MNEPHLVDVVVINEPFKRVGSRWINFESFFVQISTYFFELDQKCRKIVYFANKNRSLPAKSDLITHYGSCNWRRYDFFLLSKGSGGYISEKIRSRNKPCSSASCVIFEPQQRMLTIECVFTLRGWLFIGKTAQTNCQKQIRSQPRIPPIKNVVFTGRLVSNSYLLRWFLLLDTKLELCKTSRSSEWSRDKCLPWPISWPIPSKIGFCGFQIEITRLEKYQCFEFKAYQMSSSIGFWLSRADRNFG